MITKILPIMAVLLISFSAKAENQGQQPQFLFKDSVGAWNLSWKMEFTTVNNQELLVMCFDCTAHYGDRENLLTIHAKNRKKGYMDKYHDILFKKYSQLASSYFVEPKFFKTTPVGDSILQQFFLLTEIEFGTGHFNMEHVYHIDSTGEISEIPNIPREIPFDEIMKDGESVKKNGHYKISGDTLYYMYGIWGKNDSYNFPRSGRVVTTYGIFADSVSGEYYMQAVKRTRDSLVY